MAINASQHAQIEPYLPRQRGNVSIANRNLINALLYVAEHGCK
jgi:transposase